MQRHPPAIVVCCSVGAMIDELDELNAILNVSAICIFILKLLTSNLDGRLFTLISFSSNFKLRGLWTEGIWHGKFAYLSWVAFQVAELQPRSRCVYFLVNHSHSPCERQKKKFPFSGEQTASWPECLISIIGCTYEASQPLGKKLLLF